MCCYAIVVIITCMIDGQAGAACVCKRRGGAKVYAARLKVKEHSFAVLCRSLHPSKTCLHTFEHEPTHGTEIYMRMSGVNVQTLAVARDLKPEGWMDDGH